MEKEIKVVAEEIVAIGKRIYDKGFVASNDGNISVRLSNDRVLVTPSGVSKGFMQPSDMIITDMQGNIIEGDKKTIFGTTHAPHRVS